ncbi:hypothetical protein [Erythrobacter sp. CCH5-A1]|jgi:hypothetical protein|uniref:hypothetical protein n=1 Tax=Erythrobacter sp. CCH5-A1 TaxID=1768792 RepID=UPI00082E881D|nr:hypothetical protein [Erythrobacter sp. CCH5-A1]
MAKIIYHPGTGTYIGLDGCMVIDLPEEVGTAEEIEEYLDNSPEGTDLGMTLILPMTAIDNAVLEQDGEVPDIEWRGNGDRTLWIGVDGLSVKLRRENCRLTVAVFGDSDEAAAAEFTVACEATKET